MRDSSTIPLRRSVSARQREEVKPRSSGHDKGRTGIGPVPSLRVGRGMSTGMDMQEPGQPHDGYTVHHPKPRHNPNHTLVTVMGIVTLV